MMQQKQRPVSLKNTSHIIIAKHRPIQKEIQGIIIYLFSRTTHWYCRRGGLLPEECLQMWLPRSEGPFYLPHRHHQWETNPLCRKWGCTHQHLRHICWWTDKPPCPWAFGLRHRLRFWKWDPQRVPRVGRPWSSWHRWQPPSQTCCWWEASGVGKPIPSRSFLLWMRIFPGRERRPRCCNLHLPLPLPSLPCLAWSKSKLPTVNTGNEQAVSNLFCNTVLPSYCLLRGNSLTL